MMAKAGPDGCHSWVVAAGCCFINTMLFGMARLSGVLFVASMSAFRVTREEASLPYTLAAAVRNTAGPLVGYLGHKLGVRLVTSCGSVLGALGIAMCFLAEDITTITVLWGVIFGLGYGMGNVLLPVSINQYFDKKRATASGISFSGACIGSFIMPPIVEFLINSYGLSGTFLVLAGFVFNCLPAALLLSKPNFLSNEHSAEKESITQETKFNLYTVEKPNLIEKKNNLLDSKNGDLKNPRIVDEDVRTVYYNAIEYEDSTTESQTISRKNSSVASVKSLSVDKLNGEKFSKIYVNQGYQYDREEDSQTYQKQLSKSPEISEKKSTFQSFSVIFDPIFILIALTLAAYTTIFVCMMTIIVDFARDIGVGVTEEKYILMSLSVGDLIGRLGLGWVTDGGYMTRSNFAALCCFTQGLTTTVMAWSNGFPMLVTMAALYGFSEAGFIFIIPLLIAEFIEEEKQTVAIPTSNFLSGPLCLALAPMIGFFRDNIGSYDFIFYGMGVLSFMCTLSYLLTPCIDRCRK